MTEDVWKLQELRFGERVRSFLVTSVAVLVAMVMLVVRMVDFISQVSGLT